MSGHGKTCTYREDSTRFPGVATCSVRPLVLQQWQWRFCHSTAARRWFSELGGDMLAEIKQDVHVTFLQCRFSECLTVCSRPPVTSEVPTLDSRG